jgi:dsRNA-specific ribonuclease
MEAPKDPRHDSRSDARWDARLDALQQRLGYRFIQGRLLTRALTHRSQGADHNERLEFLGDAVLNLAVSSLLYDRFSGSDEGDLTRVRAHLVREDSLHRVALGEAYHIGPMWYASPRARCAAAARSGRRSWPMRWRR